MCRNLSEVKQYAYWILFLLEDKYLHDKYCNRHCMTVAESKSSFIKKGMMISEGEKHCNLHSPPDHLWFR